MPKAIAALTTQDIRNIASSLSLQADASKRQILDAIRALDPKKSPDTIRLIALTLGMAATSTRDEVLAAVDERLQEKEPSAAQKLLRRRVHEIVAMSGGELTFAAALDVITRVFPHDADEASSARRVRATRQPASDELVGLIRARMAEAKIDWYAAFSAVATEKPDLITRASAERDEQRVATSA